MTTQTKNNSLLTSPLPSDSRRRLALAAAAELAAYIVPVNPEAAAGKQRINEAVVDGDLRDVIAAVAWAAERPLRRKNQYGVLSKDLRQQARAWLAWVSQINLEVRVA